ncbi:MAG: protein kinase [Candidatus Omnitrophica bacterium]|nr:protein kinase [Candidatus Omnitrophota bacterium]
MTNPSGIPDAPLTLRVTKTADGVEFRLLSPRSESLAAGVSALNEEGIADLGAQLREAIGDTTLWGQSRNGSESIESLTRHGFQSVFPSEIQRELHCHPGEFLSLELEPRWLQFPWELLHDGVDFLGCRYAVGRVVPAWRSGRIREPRNSHLAFLLVSDPAGNLAGAAREGANLCALLENNIHIALLLLNGRVSKPDLVESLPRADLVHYSGHTSAPTGRTGGWELQDGVLDPDWVKKALGNDPGPLLVFNNACHGADQAGPRLLDEGFRGMAETFLSAGTSHYIGAWREVRDDAATFMARAFYRALLEGASVGSALRSARLETRASLGAADFSWAQYVLFGNPATGLPSGGTIRTETKALVLLSSEPPRNSASHPSPFPSKEAESLLSSFSGAETLKVEDRTFLAILPRASDAVRFALMLQWKIRSEDPLGDSRSAPRVAVHSGEITTVRTLRGGALESVEGYPLEVGRSLLSLATDRQILISRPTFDDARAVLRGSEIAPDCSVAWLDHGAYKFADLDQTVDVCEVGEIGWAALSPPPDLEFAYRHVSRDQEPVLGWRPALDQEVPTSPAWVLVEKLGEGGFGEVWRARRKEIGEQRVFKFCFREERVRSLKREISLFRLLREAVGDHPNIVRLYDIFLDHPPYYIVMEDVPGSDLEHYFVEGDPLAHPQQSRLEIVAKVADALQVAHDAGVIHRDVKPSNILLVGSLAELKNLRVKLGDFGIGQVIDPQILPDSPLGGFTQTFTPTEFVSHTGSRLYMAPELLVGRASSIRSDIYSLGVVLYQLLIGDFRRPLTADWRSDIEDPILRKDLERCLAGDPQERFSSAGELARSLRSVEERRASWLAMEEAHRKRERHRRALVFLSLIFLGVCLLTVALGYGLVRERRAVIEARAARAQAEEELYVSTIKLAERAVEDRRFGPALEFLMSAPPILRNWEWGRLLFLCNQDLMTLRVSPGAVRAVAFHPKGNWVFTGDMEGTVRAWDILSGAEVARLEGCRGPVHGLAISPSGELVAAGGEDGTIRLWSLSEGRMIRRFTRIRGEFRALRFSSDGSRIVAGQTNSSASVWDVSSGELLTVVRLPQDIVYAVGFSPDGTVLATGGGQPGDCDCSLRVWDATTGELLHTMPNPRQDIYALEFSPDGRLIATGNQDRVVRVWDWRHEALVKTLEGHKRQVWSVAFSPDGKRIAAPSLEGIIRLWDLETGLEERLLEGHVNSVRAVAFSSDGNLLASGGDDGSCRLWDVSPTFQPSPVLRQTDEVHFVAANPKEDWVVGGGHADPLVRGLWLGTWENTEPRLGHLTGANGGQFSPDGRVLAVTDGDSVAIWRGGSNQVARIVGGPLNEAKGFAYAPDGKHFATGDRDGRVVIWSLPDGTVERDWRASQEEVCGVAWSPDSALLATGDRENLVRVWDAREGTLLRTLEGHTDAVKSVAFSPDGERLASGSDDETGRVWDRDGGRTLFKLLGHNAYIHQICYSPDGSRLFTASEDTTCKVWEASTGRELLTLRGHSRPATCLSYSPSAPALVSGSIDRTIRLWPAFPWLNTAYASSAGSSPEARIEEYKRSFWKLKRRTAEECSPPPAPAGLDPIWEQAARAILEIQDGPLLPSDIERVSRLRLAAANGPPLDQLSCFPNLADLCILDSTLGNLTPLARLPLLTRLDLTRSSLLAPETLASLEGLTSLTLSKTNVRDLSPLARMSGLLHLGLEGCEVESLGPLRNLKQLAHLLANRAGIRDVSALAGLTELEHLHLDGNLIEDLDPLSELSNLVVLELSSNPVRDLAPLSELTHLRGLNLANCGFSDIGPLATLVHLKRLILGINRVADIRPLRNLRELERLSLMDSPAPDRETLAALENLNWLDLDRTGIEDLSALAPLQALRELSLQDNPVKDVSPLRNLRNLRRVNLHGTQVSDLSPLVGGNPLKPLEVDIHSTPMAKRDVAVLAEWEAQGVRLVGLE